MKGNRPEFYSYSSPKIDSKVRNLETVQIISGNILETRFHIFGDSYTP